MITVLNFLLPFSPDYSVSHNRVIVPADRNNYCGTRTQASRILCYVKVWYFKGRGGMQMLLVEDIFEQSFVMHQEHLGTQMRKKVSLACHSSGFCYLNSGVTLLVMVFPAIFLARNKEENIIKLFVMYPPIK